MAEKAEKISAEEVRAGRKEIDYYSKKLQNAIDSALLKFGGKDKKLERKTAAEKAHEMANYIEEQILKEAGDEKYIDKPLYERTKYLFDKHHWDRNTFISTVVREGISDDTIGRLVNSMMDHLTRSHRAAATADIHMGNLEYAIQQEIEEKYKVKLGAQHKGYPEATNLLYGVRTGTLTPEALKNLPGVREKKEKYEK